MASRPQLSVFATGNQIGFVLSKLANGWPYTVQSSLDLKIWCDTCAFIAASKGTNWSNTIDPLRKR
jgi:hypothetical protein